MKNKKQIIIIIGIVLVIILGVLAFNFINKNNSKNDADLKEILNNSSEIEAIIDNNKKIELVSLKENVDEVKIWVFSEPIYIGKFKLIKEDDKYYLEGIEDILKTKDLETGSHRLLIMNDDKSLGYVKIEIDTDKSLKSTSEENNKSENVNETETTSNITSTTTTTTTKVRETKTTTKTQEEVKCTPKKFKNKYTYVYDDETTCVRNGDQIDAWNYFRANDIPATTYGCEKIVDECGNTYYGVYYGNTEGKKFYY